MSDTNTRVENTAINSLVSDLQIVDGELHLVTTINDLVLFEHPQYLQFIDDAAQGEETQAIMTLSTPFEELFREQINSELHRGEGDVVFLSTELKPKYDSIREELVKAIALIDTLKFEEVAT